MQSSPTKIIDLRSDTVTKPSSAMRKAMMSAEVGDDVYGEDPTVIQLEKMTADLLGKEAALFLPSGTQSNLTALLSHCNRGDEYIAGDSYHTYRYEAGGGAVLGGISPCPIAANKSGGLDVDSVCAAIKSDDFHFARTKLICLENTAHGKTQNQDAIEAVAEAAHSRGLSVHLDGARLMNAAADSGLPPQELTASADSVSLCLSKGLGAPAGSVLCGEAEFILRARRNRKILGGGMRQAGILAAAGIFALENNIPRLSDDHANARKLADGLSQFAALKVESEMCGTNMVFITPASDDRKPLCRHLESRGIIVGGRDSTMRLVTHLDISADAIDAVVGAVDKYFSGVV